jgi:hypothetical protein
MRRRVGLVAGDRIDGRDDVFHIAAGDAASAIDPTAATQRGTPGMYPSRSGIVPLLRAGPDLVITERQGQAA